MATDESQAAKALERGLEKTGHEEAGASEAKRVAKKQQSGEPLSAKDEVELVQAVGVLVDPHGTGTVAPREEPLRRELVKAMAPFATVDADLFMAVNRMPHPEWANRALGELSHLWTGGFGWVVFLAALSISDRRRAVRAAVDVLPSLWIATNIVEHPVKQYFHRRRPFVRILRAVVIGKRPASYSFPSGHSAAAFAGAILLAAHYPRFRKLIFGIAATVAFSRIYLGAHYPGDVLSGAASGALIARVSQTLLRWIFGYAREKRG